MPVDTKSRGRGRKKKTLIQPIADLPSATSRKSSTSTVAPATKPADPVVPAAPPQKKETDRAIISTIRRTSLKVLSEEEREKTSQVRYASQMPADAKNDFSQEELLKYWTEYAENLTIKKIHLKNTLLSCKPSLKENYRIEVSVYNPSQKDEILDNNADILGHLCSRLHNSRIEMDIRIVEKEEKEMIYTAMEKYNYLKKKNPTLEKLKDLFQLTIE